MSKRQGDSKKRFAFAAKLFAEGSTSGELPSEIQIVPTGKWNHPAYGEMEITPADITEMKRNFDDGVRLDLPITAGHDNGMSGGELPAVAWYGELIDKGVNGLWSTVDWLSEGADLIKERSFKYFSSEFYADYEDPETGERRKNVLVGGALTNRPYFKEMTPVGAFSETGIMSQSFTEDMKLKDILAKKPTELSETEKAFVLEHKSELTAEQTTAFASVFDESAPEESEEEKAEREAKEQGDANEAKGLNRDGSVKIEASEKGIVKISATEYATLQEKANKGHQAFAEVEKMKLDKEVEKLVFSSSNAEGRILPKGKDAVVSFMVALSEKQRDQFRNILNSLPTHKLFGEMGDAGRHETADTTAAKVDALVRAKITASEGKLSYAVALKQVMASEPKLASEYNAEIEGAQGDN